MTSSTALFSPLTIKDVTFKNRITMSPMCMYSSTNKDGKVAPWHYTHYISRAVGQVGLIMVEATAVQMEGRISPYDLGIWDDQHIPNLKKLVDSMKEHGAKTAIQLAHAGRKAELNSSIYAPSPLAFENMKQPLEMSEADIADTITAFKEGARRAKEAGFDVIEIHGAHGYLINQFLSPLTNKREDDFGGDREKRFTFLDKVIKAVKTVWNGPLFVRLSVDEYAESGNTMDDFIYYAKKMKTLGIDLIDCSTGGVIHTPIHTYPGYQIVHAETIKHSADIATGAVGMISSAFQAEEILQNNRADLIFIGRALLKDPYWPRTAAVELNEKLDPPVPYYHGW
ncbi:NADPH dehydrogenase NamA [Salipaludibacillus agaradhaerens]|uniref:NADPH dehydrogenase NamA n=1 Tax=Salipaludibacillus agaradhaerens TaxID=76935 RepID=A0A9Q4B1S8_SALAG|nr:NADPH dehydrogenase NamA [Salipaludibacillus agaradhaerens]MCR6096626.1 NADPH dehydrogenase NamA [Salipaludibacillus agaradhaerens]MCR6113815.1 NADPH dehydrogenase NamA [Salipaludibacillus agaradhaerens]